MGPPTPLDPFTSKAQNGALPLVGKKEKEKENQNPSIELTLQDYRDSV